MKKYNRLISIVISFAVLISAGLQTNSVFSQGTRSPREGASNAVLASDEPRMNKQMQFGIIDEHRGWVALGGELYISDDQGETWTDITPMQKMNTYQKVSFHPDGQGRIVTVNLYDENVQASVLKTANFGKDWQEIDSNLQFALLDSHAGPIGELYAQWRNANEGWLMAKRASGVNFSQGVLLRTSDGGKHWSALPSPAGERFIFVDSAVGFMLSPGEPEMFHYTTDGGRVWQDFVLPTQPLKDTSFTVNLPVLTSDGGLLLPLELKFDDGGRQVGFYHAENLLPNFNVEESFELIESKVSETSHFVQNGELV